MSRKSTDKQFWEMTPAELRQATMDFDEEFVAEKAKSLSPSMRSRWERAKAKSQRPVNGRSQKTIAVRLEKTLLDQCIALAKKKRITRDSLIARGLKALLAAEGET